MSRTPYMLVDAGDRAAPVAAVRALRPGDAVRVLVARGKGDNADRASLWFGIVKRVDEQTFIGAPELYSKALTEGFFTSRDRITFNAQHVLEVRTTTSLRSLDPKSFAKAKAAIH